jgi:dihydrofolate reductase
MSDSSRVRVYLGCSLDGCIAGPDNDLSFLHAPGPADPPPADPEALAYPEFMAQVGAMLMGRTTHDVVASMPIDWPYGDTPVLVATTRPLEDRPETVRGITGDIGTLIAQAKEAAGAGDVYLDGGALVRQALAAGLVDELCLTILPVILGRGVRLFDGLEQSTLLEFTGQCRSAGGMVQLTARPRR